jgi:sensor domain CHASE-containing protein
VIPVTPKLNATLTYSRTFGHLSESFRYVGSQVREIRHGKSVTSRTVLVVNDPVIFSAAAP